MVQEQKYLSVGEIFDLRGKVAAITGGASGIGFAAGLGAGVSRRPGP